MIKVVNKKTHKLTIDDSVICVDRSTCLGNPYSHLPESSAAIRVETREAAVAKYKLWLIQKIEEKDRFVCRALNDIFIAAFKDYHELKHTYLECHCEPKACHAQHIADMIWGKIMTHKDALHSRIFTPVIDGEAKTGMHSITFKGGIAVDVPARLATLRNKPLDQVLKWHEERSYKNERINLKFE